MDRVWKIIKQEIRREQVQIIGIAILLNMIIECLSRRSFSGIFLIITNPIIFLYNTLIIGVTLSICVFFRKKIFTLTLIGILWLSAAVTNFIVLSSRKTPFTAMDIYLMHDAIKVIPIYMNIFQIIAGIIAVILIVAGLIVWWFKAPGFVGKIHYIKSLTKFVTACAVLFIITNGCISNGILAIHFGNLADAYKKYGFAYCFSNSIVNRGISKPDDYDVEHVRKIKEQMDTPKQDIQEKPNVIFLQLESFMDPNLVQGVKFSDNPVPCLESLFQNFPSGYLSVPVFGAGTVNTEFEVQTGMNMDDFGAGEYPYRTVLQSTTCESAAYDLKNLGYSTHVIHNNDATFYDRHKVFPNLGYDSFTPIEYMSAAERTPIGWAKDKILTDEIIKTLDSTPNQDYIYAISVQGHGDYPQNYPKDFSPQITTEGFFDSEAENAFNYYVNQIHEMDNFLQELTEKLSQRQDKTVLVLYGDHLPGFNFKESDLVNHDLYQTKYVIWNNFNLPKQNLDMEAYQLSAYVFKQLGISEGIVMKYHQTKKEDPNYLKNLKLLEYDLLYGDRDAYGGKNPFEPTQMEMGIQKISITGAYNYKDYICIEGDNFNDFSVVGINGKEFPAEVINSHLIQVKGSILRNSDVVYIIQKGKDKIELSRTRGYVYNGN